MLETQKEAIIRRFNETMKHFNNYHSPHPKIESQKYILKLEFSLLKKLWEKMKAATETFASCPFIDENLDECDQNDEQSINV